MCWPLQFDWRVTGDGLLTFAGGAAAFFAIWRQTQHADAGLREQILDINRRQDDERVEKARSSAQILLREIDLFYRCYLRTSRNSLKTFTSEREPPSVMRPRNNPLSAITDGSARISDLDPGVAVTVKHFYGVASIYLDAVFQYADYYEMALGGNERAIKLAGAFVPRLSETIEGVVSDAYFVCGTLCHYLNEEFHSPAVAVSDDPAVVQDKDTNKLLNDMRRETRPLPKE